MEWIRTLTAGFRTEHLSEIQVATMNGNSATAFQYFGRKDANSHDRADEATV
jgi:hypothetical protein